MSSLRWWNRYLFISLATSVSALIDRTMRRPAASVSRLLRLATARFWHYPSTPRYARCSHHTRWCWQTAVSYCRWCRFVRSSSAAMVCSCRAFPAARRGPTNSTAAQAERRRSSSSAVDVIDVSARRVAGWRRRHGCAVRPPTYYGA